jgi:hypothetical protein
MNDKTDMRSESNSQIPNQEYFSAPEGNQPESVMTSLLALNNWLLAFEDRTEGADRRSV